jgi:histidine triad (HIT) family protein
MGSCLFCQIAAGEIPATKRFEDDEIVAFDDIHPQAPVHILIVPKRHLTSLSHATDQDQDLLGQLLFTVKSLAQELKLDGYKTRINTGRSGGQVVDHLHVHLVGGTPQSGQGSSAPAPDVYE